MPLWTTLALLALTACSAAVVLYWGFILAHIFLTARQVPTARAALRPAADDAPAVCVVVPAHNEEAVIEGLARSLAAQDYPRARVRFLFTLDRCTDRTRQIIEQVFAGDDRLEIVEIAHCPEGWSGKVNALWTALGRSRSAQGADVLLFADADTLFDPACIRATAALLLERNLDMLSLLSTQRTVKWFEWAVQPAACLELIRQYPIRRANSPDHRRPFANGQFIMFRRDAYDRIGGHASVKDQVFEDVHIARIADKHKLRIGVVLADGMLHCRMYKDWPAFQRGWKRIFAEAANLKLSRLHKTAWRLRAVATIFPAAALAAAAWGWTLRLGEGAPGDALGSIVTLAAALMGSAAVLVYIAAVIGVLRAAKTPLAAGLLFPVGSWMTAGIILEAASDLANKRPMQWAGREYQRAAR